MNFTGQLINYWTHKGHKFGQCYVNRDLDLMYVNIPKNASTFAKFNMAPGSWTHDNYYHCDPAGKIIVIIRDPIERWVSGVAEYYFNYHQSILLENLLAPAHLDLLFDAIAVDDHTERQVLFLNDLEFNDCVFFKCNDNLNKNIADFFNSNYNITYDVAEKGKMHISADFPRKQELKNIFQTVIDTQPKYKQQLIDFYKEDYTLIEQASFYGNN